MSGKCPTPAHIRMMAERRGSHFFDPRTMRYFGDTMRNYGTRWATLKRYSGDTVECVELYRRRPVKCGLKSSSYFLPTGEQIHGEEV